MPDIRSLKQAISEIFAQHESRCLWFSGGSDSTLLLRVMLELDEPFGILTFDAAWSKEQRKQVDAVIMEKNLQVFSYPPAANVLVGQNGDLALVSQYAIDGGGNTAMLVRDLVNDPKRCYLDLDLGLAKSGIAPIEYAVHIWGLRRDDEHWISEKPLIDSENQVIGNKQFLFPLAEFTKQDVIVGLKTYGVEWEQPSDKMDLGNVNCCHNCLKTDEKPFCPKTGGEIDRVDWDRTGNLEKIRAILR